MIRYPTTAGKVLAGVGGATRSASVVGTALDGGGCTIDSAKTATRVAASGGGGDAGAAKILGALPKPESSVMHCTALPLLIASRQATSFFRHSGIDQGSAVFAGSHMWEEECDLGEGLSMNSTYRCRLRGVSRTVVIVARNP